MKNLHLIQTTKEQHAIIQKNTGLLLVQTRDKVYTGTKLNIYITSDEEIKDEDYCVHTNQKSIIKIGKGEGKLMKGHLYLKKIILTTDQDLITDGVQAIDDEFLEWFVSNPSCEYVDVKKQYITPLGDVVDFCYDNERLNYKIIIPQEENFKSE